MFVLHIMMANHQVRVEWTEMYGNWRTVTDHQGSLLLPRYVGNHQLKCIAGEFMHWQPAILAISNRNVF